MRNKWRILLLALVVVVALSVSAAAATAAGAKNQATVTISFAANIENKPAWDLMIANFERVYPDIQIEATYVPFSQYVPLLLTRLQAGNAPDVFATNAGAGHAAAVYALGSQGKLLDLTGRPWVKRVPPFFRKLLQVKGRFYGFPGVFQVQGLMYNRDLFKQLGLAIPTSFSGLLALCGKIKAAGKVPIAMGAASASSPLNMISALGTDFVYSKDPNWTLERIQHKVTFASSPLWQRMLQTIVQMKDTGCFQPVPEGTTNITENAMVANSQAVMMFASANQAAPIRTINPNVNLGFFPFPADNAKDTKVTVHNGNFTLVVSKTTAHPTEVKTFINFLGRTKQNTLLAKVTDSAAGYDLIKGKLLPDIFKEVSKDLTTPGKSATAWAFSWPRPDKGLYVPTFYQQVVGLFTGQRTPDQILQTMDALWDRP